MAVDDTYRMIPSVLDECIKKDLKADSGPCVVAALGTTGSTAIDPLAEIAAICRQHDLWLHVDAAFAGSALLLPEYRWMIKGIEGADSFVFNPHKWLFTNFDCSAYFIRDRHALTRTFEILPEYLRTATQGQVNDYCDCVQLSQKVPGPEALVCFAVLWCIGITGQIAGTYFTGKLAGGADQQGTRF
ncbi:MAG: pyridoxal-dependent decarboxylase [Bacteroidales bacterium]